MKRTKRFIILLTLLTAVLLPVRAAAQPDYIRLHILADSDRLHDQAVKLCVRDAVRACAAEALADCRCPDEAWSILCGMQTEFLTIARECAEKYGFTGDVSVELGTFPFPDKTYGSELVPAGDYRAVRVRLGEGTGRNWWCVVYPSLCHPGQADTDRPVEFYSSLMRWAVRMWEAMTR